MRTAFLTVNGRRTRVMLAGNPGDSPVLLLHGIGRSAEDWARQVPELAARHRVIAIDMAGFGFSERLPAPITLETFARAAIDTLDALHEHDPVTVFGHSLGGAIAQQILVLTPDRVSGLVLISPAGFGPEVTPLLRLMTLPGAAVLLSHPTRFMQRVTECSGVVNRSIVTADRIDHAIAIARLRTPNDVLVETARHLITLRGCKSGWRHELLTDASRHKRPMLIVWGANDRILPAKHIDAARRTYPHAQTHVFTDVGHNPHEEVPRAFADMVAAFLATVTLTGTGTARC